MCIQPVTMAVMLYLMALLFFDLAIGNNLDVENLVQVITRTEAEIAKYEYPENAYEYRPANKTYLDYGVFDYIIVGAGSAGAVLATRLSENENITILLLEAGGEESTYSDIMGKMLQLQSTKFNWGYKSTPQTTCCLGMVDCRCSYPCGKALGGTSTINAALYVRGNRHDFDSLARYGNEGWSYEEVLPYFIKSENSQVYGDPGFHGSGGFLNVEYPKPYSPLVKSFIEANEQLGRKLIDYNGNQQLGVGYTQFSTIDGRRQSTSKAFLSKAKRRRNLKVLINSYVNKVLINEHKEAYGVTFDRNGQAHLAKARREIILSAGAIGSPHLLMLSGIGPSKVLEPLKIPIVQDLAVGENYKDHPAIFALFFKTNYTEPAKSLHELVEQYVNGNGPLTIAANAQSIVFLRTASATTPKDVPNIEIIFVPQTSWGEYLKKPLNYNDDTYNTFWPMDDARTSSMSIMLLHPKSQGTITLKSSNPYDFPEIDPKFLSDENNEDIEMLYEAINMIREMLDTESFRQVDAKLEYKVLPACRNHEYMSKKQWLCQIRQLTTHMDHPIGTCKMGPISNKGAVVDNELRVHGVKRLRVADTSIFPGTTSGHPNAPVIIVAEKLADILKRQVTST